MRPVAALATVAIALSLALPATEAGALSCRRKASRLKMARWKKASTSNAAAIA